jgi:hypothetical protein
MSVKRHCRLVVRSLLTADIGTKLTMPFTMALKDFQSSYLAFFEHHPAMLNRCGYVGADQG